MTYQFTKDSADADKARVRAAIDRMFPARRVRRVLLINPPEVDASKYNYAVAKRGRYLNYAPYGLAALAAHLRKDGIEVSIVNLNNAVLKACRQSASREDFDFDGAWKGELAKGLAEAQADLIGVTCMFTQTHPSFVNVCRAVHEAAPETPLITGGVHPTNALSNPTSSSVFLSDLPMISAFFLNEAELALRQFVRAVNGLADETDLCQVILRGADGDISFADRNAPDDQDLDVIPAHDLVDPRELSKSGKVGAFYCFKDAQSVVANVLATRGCRAQCTFCSVRNFNGVGVRRRSVQSVIDELLMLRNDYNVEHIMWLDDDFLYNTQQSMQLFEEMVKQKVGLTWDCTNGVIAASCTDEVISAAAAAGCVGLQLGMESGNPQILREVRKPGTVKNFLNAAEVLRKHEQIHARVFLIIGFPGETYSQILDTINVAREMRLDWHSIQILQPLPNTPIFDKMVAQGLVDAGDFENVRYYVSSYGKGSKQSEDGRDLLCTEFSDAFNVADMNKVPDKADLRDIWNYMIYHLNYEPILRQTSPVKMRQQLTYLSHLVNVISPTDAFSLYFVTLLQERLFGKSDPEMVGRLKDVFARWPDWNLRFKEFNLPLPG